MSTKTAVRAKAKPGRSVDLKPEYRFDYTQSKSNRFASKMQEGSVAVVLDPDVASVFQTAESVNTVLRALRKTMPNRSSGRRGRGPSPAKRLSA